jgi:hypothetical protein
MLACGGQIHWSTASSFGIVTVRFSLVRCRIPRDRHSAALRPQRYDLISYDSIRFASPTTAPSSRLAASYAAVRLRVIASADRRSTLILNQPTSEIESDRIGSAHETMHAAVIATALDDPSQQPPPSSVAEPSADERRAFTDAWGAEYRSAQPDAACQLVRTALTEAPPSSSSSSPPSIISQLILDVDVERASGDRSVLSLLLWNLPDACEENPAILTLGCESILSNLTRHGFVLSSDSESHQETTLHVVLRSLGGPCNIFGDRITPFTVRLITILLAQPSCSRALLNHSNRDGRPVIDLLIDSLSRQSTDAFASLILRMHQLGADLNLLNRTGSTALWSLIHQGEAELILRLLVQEPNLLHLNLRYRECGNRLFTEIGEEHNELAYARNTPYELTHEIIRRVAEWQEQQPKPQPPSSQPADGNESWDPFADFMKETCSSSLSVPPSACASAAISTAPISLVDLRRWLADQLATVSDMLLSARLLKPLVSALDCEHEAAEHSTAVRVWPHVQMSALHNDRHHAREDADDPTIVSPPLHAAFSAVVVAFESKLASVNLAETAAGMKETLLGCILAVPTCELRRLTRFFPVIVDRIRTMPIECVLTYGDHPLTLIDLMLAHGPIDADDPILTILDEILTRARQVREKVTRYATDDRLWSQLTFVDHNLHGRLNSNIDQWMRRLASDLRWTMLTIRIVLTRLEQHGFPHHFISAFIPDSDIPLDRLHAYLAAERHTDWLWPSRVDGRTLLQIAQLSQRSAISQSSGESAWPSMQTPVERYAERLVERATEVVRILEEEVTAWQTVHWPRIRSHLDDHLIPDLTRMIIDYLTPPSGVCVATDCSSA